MTVDFENVKALNYDSKDVTCENDYDENAIASSDSECAQGCK